MLTLEEHNNQIKMKKRYTKENLAGVLCSKCSPRYLIEMIYIDTSIKNGEAPPKLKEVICPICEDSGKKMMEYD